MRISGKTEATVQDPRQKRQPPGEATFLISHFRAKHQSCDHSVFQKWCRLAVGIDPRRRVPVAASIAIVGRVKRLLKIGRPDEART